MTATKHRRPQLDEPPFSSTAEKYNTEYANGKVPGSNFPYYEVQRLPGILGTAYPGALSGRCHQRACHPPCGFRPKRGCPLQYQERDVSKYLWMQASRGMLPWHEIFNIVRGAKKRMRRHRVAHYFGYNEVIGPKGVSHKNKRIKLIRYITQEGVCVGCQMEFQFSRLTLDRIKPGAAGGEYELSNVQLMCKPCNNAKADNYRDRRRNEMTTTNVPPNQLYFGDNFEILRQHIADESVDLIYLDPPFNSNATYNVLFRERSGEESAAQITAFDDTWRWGYESELAYQEVITEQAGKVGELLAALRAFLGQNDMMAYLTMMAQRMVELHRVLKSTAASTCIVTRPQATTSSC